MFLSNRTRVFVCFMEGLSPCRYCWPRPDRKCRSHIQPCEPHPRRVCWRWWRRAGWASASHWRSWHWWCPALYTALSAPPLHFQSVNAQTHMLSILLLSTHISLSWAPVLRSSIRHDSKQAIDKQSATVFLCHAIPSENHLIIWTLCNILEDMVS